MIRKAIDNLTPGPSPKERGDLVKQTDFFSENVGEGMPGYITTDPATYRSLKEFTKENRKKQTQAEEVMWNTLRNRKLGFKFRRQHIIEKYIVDFVCLEKKLIIEIDGGYHSRSDQIEYDHNRTDHLKFAEYNELRFKNEAVLNNLEEVKDLIRSHLEGKIVDPDKLTNSPLLWRGAGGEVATGSNNYNK